MKTITIGPHISTYERAADFLAYIKTLRIASNAKASKTVPEVVLIFGTRTMVRINRPRKEVTLAEVQLIAAEYMKEQQEIYDLITKRKIKIIDQESGEILNAAKPRTKSGRPRIKRTKKDAEHLKTSQREDQGGNQLIKLGLDSDLP